MDFLWFYHRLRRFFIPTMRLCPPCRFTFITQWLISLSCLKITVALNPAFNLAWSKDVLFKLFGCWSSLLLTTTERGLGENVLFEIEKHRIKERLKTSNKIKKCKASPSRSWWPWRCQRWPLYPGKDWTPGTSRNFWYQCKEWRQRRT